MAAGRAQFVLIGGEAREWGGVAPAERHLEHTSIEFVCEAYAQLRRWGVPSAQIITIVQARDYTDGLEAAAVAAERREDAAAGQAVAARCRRAKARLEAQADYQLLLAEGGPSYDGEAVNPATVWAVLRGEASKRVPVVVAADSSFLFFAVYSHGSFHPVHAPPPGQPYPDYPLLPDELDPLAHEWFFDLPYPGHDASLLDFVATAGAHPSTEPRCLLYAVQLRAILAHCFAVHPHRPVLGLLNFCKSGGNLEFMRRPLAVQQHGADRWPLWLMSSASARHNALVGGLWSSLFAVLDAALNEQPADCTTLPQLYARACHRYRSDCIYELIDHIKAQAYPDFGLIDSCEDTYHRDLKALLVSHTTGEPDFDQLARLQHDYAAGVKHGRPILIVNPDTRQPVELVDVVRHALKQIALPEMVYGAKSSIDTIDVLSYFRF